MKKFLCLILTVLTVAAMIPLALSVSSAGDVFPFTDVPADKWYRPEVEFAWRTVSCRASRRRNSRRDPR